ncbi:MAG: putative LPS assembly protein LptD [Bacteroidota bacterium]
MKKALFIVLFPLLFLEAVVAQIVPDEATVDTVVAPVDSLLLRLDSLGLTLDSLGFPADSLTLRDSLLRDSLVQRLDSLQNLPPGKLSQIELSEDGLEDQVDYSAQDSMIYDIKNQKVYLYGSAKVAYQDLTIDAAYIEFDWSQNIVTAEGRPDSTGRLAGNPDFKDKNQGFRAKRMRYNFKTRKGIIYNATTKQGNDLYVLGARAKFFGSDPQDTTSQDVVYSQDAIFTTCNHPEPHFGIRSRRQKVIPNKMVVVGPSNLEIGGVPTPLWLPFGLYPITNDGSSGLIFPRDFQSNPRLGFGLQGVGWYFPIGDRLDLKLTGDIYTRGTWIVRAESRYKTRYKYNGSLLLEYSNNRIEDNMANVNNQTAIKINWSHNQAPKAHPYNTFNSRVNIQTNGFQRELEVSPTARQQNTLTSNVSYSRRFAGKPYNFTASFQHSQNTTSGAVTFNLPDLRFTTGALYPFKRQVSKGGKEQWYEKINVNYTADLRNIFETSDSTMFTRRTLESARSGMRQDLTVNANFKFLKYFNLSPNASYSENWYLQTIQKTFDPTVELSEPDTVFITETEFFLQQDTVGYGTVITDTIQGFAAFHNFKNASIGLNTKIFGQLDIPKGYLRGIRHTMTPEVRFGYQPAYSRLIDSVDTDIRPEFNRVQTFTRFENGLFDRPSTAGESMRLSFTLNNIFEAKTYSKRDSTTENIQLLRAFNLRTSYDLSADSLGWDDLRLDWNTTLFKGLTSLRGGATYSFYALNTENEVVNVFQWDQKRRPLRFVSANMVASTRLTVRQLQQLFTGQNPQQKKKDKDRKNTSSGSGSGTTGPQAASFEDILSSLNLTHDIRLNWNVVDGRDTLVIGAHTLKLTVGNIRITDNWGVQVQQFGYDFRNQGFIYPSFGFTRDLHCWVMALDWQPTNGSFHFSLKVKPGTLDFIKVPYQRGDLQSTLRF